VNAIAKVHRDYRKLVVIRNEKNTDHARVFDEKRWS
jgi:hypothetical protein